MIYRHAGQLCPLAVLVLLASQAVAQTGFRVLPEDAAPSFSLSSDQDDEKRSREDAVWGALGAGVLGILLLENGTSRDEPAITRTESSGIQSEEGSSPAVSTLSGKRRDGGITAAPEPGSLILLFGGAAPLIHLLRRRR